MANRYNDQDYPRYNERDDRYDSRSEYDDSSKHNREVRQRDRGRGSDRGEGYYGTGNSRDFDGQNSGYGGGYTSSNRGRDYNSQDRDHDDFQSNTRSSRSNTGNFGRNTENDRTDYTLYGYDRENHYSSGSDEERGYYNRGGDYGYGSNFGTSGSNFDRMDASDSMRRGSRDYGRGSGRDRSNQSGRNENYYSQGGDYQGDYMTSERGWETENRGGSNRDERGWWDKTTDEISSWFGDGEASRRRERDMRQSGGQQTSHRGRGPKNYRRSDERIRDDINDRLTDYPYLDASDIEVEINNGEVVLTGTVESRYAKRMAEDVTEDVSGVTHVENRLRVRQNTSNSGSSGSGNLSSASTNTSTGGNLTTGGITAITGASAGTSTGSTSDASPGTSTGANASTGNTSTTGESSIGNTGDSNAPTTGRSRSKSA